MGVLETFSNSREERERKELLGRAITLYRSTREKYLELPAKCLELQEELERRGLKARLQTKALDKYPSGTKLFSFETEDELRKYFSVKPVETLNRLVKNTEETLSESWAYNTLRNWAAEATYLIKRYDEKQARKEREKEFLERSKVVITEASLWT